MAKMPLHFPYKKSHYYSCPVNMADDHILTCIIRFNFTLLKTRMFIFPWSVSYVLAEVSVSSVPLHSGCFFENSC